MESDSPLSYSAFEKYELLAQGPLQEVVLAMKKRLKAKPTASILVFSDSTGKQMDFNLRGSDAEVLARLQIFLAPVASKGPVGPGRPKIGVVAREVSLLPQHWEWLSNQSGGASATLRRLVEEKIRNPRATDLVKIAQERAHHFMSSLAGNLPHYEDALRALYRKDRKGFVAHLSEWPTPVKRHAVKLAEGAF